VCISCKEKHFFTGQNPVLIVLSDQHFPPALPSTGRQCVIIITVSARMPCCMSSLDCWKSYLKWNENIYFQPLNNIRIKYTIY
jgi:hypothetical protein